VPATRRSFVRRAFERHLNRAVRQAGVTVLFGHSAGEHGAHGAVDVADRQFDLDRLAFVDCGLGELDQLVVECLVQAVILRSRNEDRLARGVFRTWKIRL
jgi:hypothetical protein